MSYLGYIIGNYLSFWTTVSDRTHLFEDEKVKDNHAEVVHNEGLPELERLPVPHELWPQPEEEQVWRADGQRGERWGHQRPFFHTLVCNNRRTTKYIKPDSLLFPEQEQL